MAEQKWRKKRQPSQQADGDDILPCSHNTTRTGQGFIANHSSSDITKHPRAKHPRGKERGIPDFPKSATPDYREMNTVAKSTGMALVLDEFSCPLCHIIELADVFVPEHDGGILKRTGASWTCSIAPFMVAEFSISTSSAYTFKQHNQVKKLADAQLSHKRTSEASGED